jgi:hypothetical protein
MVITMLARWLRVEHKRSTEKAARSKGVARSTAVQGGGTYKNRLDFHVGYETAPRSGAQRRRRAERAPARSAGGTGPR